MTSNGKKKSNIPPMDDLVKKLTDGESGAIMQTVMLQGFVGEVLDEGNDNTRVRFYTEPTLQHFYDIDPDRIVHSIKLKPSQAPLGGTIIWLQTPQAPEQQAAPENHRYAQFFQAGV